ncbi:DUF624 domain-containing protein [Allonocardiopsis opalescens]|uniref:Uncharacterized protein DUF624 n=1 Tax=Allonocardiopsis opalescens TaxID=1144618 RepID=A0A2T0PX62_9ACTN|nr:DUF624 domain-containing protein [Allonocardiopsis opalescens]PRX96130.1 uncharacterized protein DUF624 [Allonocardiopsis opalescens]
MRGRGFALFGECLFAGVLVVLAALPAVTLLPALAAGCAHVRAQVEQEGGTGTRAFWGRFRAAWPGSLPVSAAGAVIAAVLLADLAAVRAGLPGGRYVLAVCAAAAAFAAVTALRAAAAWRPGARWWELVRAAAVRGARTDLPGTLLLAAALAAAGAATWALWPLAVPMAGCLLLAAVAVERRAAVG